MEPRCCNGQVASSSASSWNCTGLPTLTQLEIHLDMTNPMIPCTGRTTGRAAAFISRQEMLSGQIMWNDQEIFQITRFNLGSGYVYLLSYSHRRECITGQCGSQASAPSSFVHLPSARQVLCHYVRPWVMPRSSVWLISRRVYRVVRSTVSFFLFCTFVEDLTMGKGKD